MNFKVLNAIFKRDLVSYFSNPTGYVFICVFVVLSALAAFWPPEFFNNNLANLDQLSRWLPFIMLVFIPAITMSTWAEERRQGTDELLLTVPASDLDVVAGKYLAGVAIFSVSLLFSMFSIYLVFSWGLGSPDIGLYIGTYIGYWFIGIAMLAIGMAASFLTNNLTIGFILGALFNMPLALFGVADWVVKNPTLAQAIKKWSAVEQFRDFERGVLSLSGVSYFLMIAAVMLYVSMVLIGRRHWRGGDSDPMWGHFLVRACSLLVLAVGVNIFLSNHDWLRLDITSEKLNSLSSSTVRAIRQLRNDPDVPDIKIDAYVSPQVPAEYAAQKLNLISTLRELRSLSGDKIQVDVHEVENFSDEARLAEQTYGMELRTVSTKSRGARTQQEIFLGAVFRCGLDRVVLPFIDKGIPTEYELVRSIMTVAQQERKTLGVVTTDAPLFGGFSMQGTTMESPLVAELRKQYDVEQVDPSAPISKKFDVLLAVQPSSLNPQQMDNFVAAVRSGQPTAIFEDPLPVQYQGVVVGTAQPKMRATSPFTMSSAQPEPKGDITQLWNLLGARIVGDEIIWQEYTSDKAVSSRADALMVYINEANGAVEPFNAQDPISSGMNEVLMLVAGAIRPSSDTKHDITQLAVTGKQTGSMSYQECMGFLSGGRTFPGNYTQQTYVVAARIQGKSDSEAEMSASPLAPSGSAAATEGSEEESPQIDVVLVSDIDWIHPVFFMLRETGSEADAEVVWDFQNVTLVLNILDVLAGDERFVELRKRTRPHRLLTKIEEATQEHRQRTLEEIDDFKSMAEQEIAAAQAEFNQAITELEQNPQNLPAAVLSQQVELERRRAEQRLAVRIQRLNDDSDARVKQAERDLEAHVRGVQDRYKLYAVLLPPILPLLMAALVFFHRRQAESEGVSKGRLRYGKIDERRAEEAKSE